MRRKICFSDSRSPKTINLIFVRIFDEMYKAESVSKIVSTPLNALDISSCFICVKYIVKRMCIMRCTLPHYKILPHSFQ